MVIENLSDATVGEGDVSSNDICEKILPEDMTNNNSKPTLHLKPDWNLVIITIITHTGGAIGLYLSFTSAMWKTIIFAFVLDRLNMLGVIAGAHRLWSHRSYKAKLPLRIFYMIFHTSALQNSIFHWARDHRVHHKYSETDADPHNFNRGFIFSHIGWLYRQRHPESLKRLRSCDVTDLLADPVVRFNKKYYKPLSALFCFILPTVIPAYFWNETLLNAFFVAGFLRHVTVLHQVCCVNSFAHSWGYKPFDSNINPAENPLLSFFCHGEGFHNYHHVFPFDYSASELGMTLNIGTAFINLMNLVGEAYNLKSVPKSSVEARKLRNTSQNLKKREISR